MGEVRTTADALGLEATQVEIQRPEDISPAFEKLRENAQAVFVCNDALVNSNYVLINALALGAGLPTIHAEKEYAENGGLISYAANYQALFRRAADLVDKILRGQSLAIFPSNSPRSSSWL
jgi:ABC-type uncharacterized transport system substrate-binding protein